MLITLEAQEVEAELPIGVGTEYGLAVVAARGDVPLYVDRHDLGRRGVCYEVGGQNSVS